MSQLPKLYAGNRHRYAVAIIFAVFLQALAMGASAFATRQIFGSLHEVKGSEDAGVVIAFIALAGAAVVFAGARVLATRLSEQLGQSYAIAFRKNFYAHLARLPKSALSKKRVGALSIRFVGDLGAMRDWVSKGVTNTISSLVIIPAALFVLWLLMPVFFYIGATGLILSLTIMSLRTYRHNEIQADIRKQRANISIDMMERVAIAPDLRLLGRLRADFKLLERRGRDLAQAAVRRARAVELLRAIPEVVFAFAAVVLLWVSYRHGLAAGSAAAGLAVLSIITIYLRDLANVWDYWCAWKIARDKSQAIFDMPPVWERGTSKNIPNEALSLILTKCASDAIGPISFTVPAGSRTVLCGREGQVRDVFDLIAGFENLQSGQILLGDTDLHALNQRTLSNRLHILNDEAPILQGSLRRALTMGCRRRPKDDVILAALETFGLTACCERLGGLSGRINEDGRNLSRVERLKLLIVRAYLAKPRLLMVDLPKTMHEGNVAQDFAIMLDGLDATVLISQRSDPCFAFVDNSLEIGQSDQRNADDDLEEPRERRAA